MCVCEVAQSCPTLCNPVDCSPRGSSVHGILQERILKSIYTLKGERIIFSASDTEKLNIHMQKNEIGPSS